MFLALRRALPSNSVDPASREALSRSQGARLTAVSRPSSATPTDNLSLWPRTITQAPLAEPSTVAAVTLAVAGWWRNVLANLDCSRRSSVASEPGAGAISRITAVTVDTASAIATALYRSPAAIA